MNIKLAAASIAALTILAGAPMLASAQTTAALDPVVMSAQVQPDSGYMNDFEPGVISVAFQNQNTVPATDVIFELTANGAYVNSFDEAGTFAPGATTHFSAPNLSDAPNQHLTIAEVKFADGSVWYNGNGSASLAVPQ
jgi:hypothetical protein